MASSPFLALLAGTLLLASAYGQPYCDAEVAAGKTCFNEPADCMTVMECELTMTSEMLDNATTRYTLTAKSDGWVALGFSEDQLMGQDDVIMCVRKDAAVELQDRFNVENGKSNVAKENSAIGAPLDALQMESMNYSNGVISCQFVRENSIADKEHFGLGSSVLFYILFGRGPATDGNPSQHQVNPWISESRVNLFNGTRIVKQAAGTMQGMTTQPSPSPTSGATPWYPTAYVVLHLIVATLMMLGVVIDY